MPGNGNLVSVLMIYSMKCQSVKENILVVLVYRIFLVMILFTLCRAGFLIFNHKMFPDISLNETLSVFRGGFLFDISAAVYINMLIILMHTIPFDLRYSDTYQKVIKYIFFITNGLAIIINNADIIYYRFVYKRATADVFQTFEHESNLAKLFFRFQFDYWPVVIWTLFLIFLMVFLYNRIKPVRPAPNNRILYYILNILAMPLIAGLVVMGARGGYRHSTRPISISNAARFVENPRDVALVLNTPFSLIRTFNKKSLVKYEYFDEAALESIYNPHYKPSPAAPFRKENIVIIIMESFSREYIGALNKDLDDGSYKGYTPFLDSLINVSLTFEVSVANGKKSIEAMPSIFASIPSLETPYTISHYANNTINGLPGLLKPQGYYSAFFHGAPNGSMGFDSFAKMVGFDDYYGMNEYPDKNDFDGMWGVWDEPFFVFFADKLDSFSEPFLASIFSVSSHHPFKVPAKYKDRFPKGNAQIVEVVGYSDFALEELFNRASGMDWFQNTLFVITADHTNESIRREFQNDFGAYSIPVIFYKPGSDMHGVKSKIAQQIDIMPSILSYLNYGSEFIAFGNNLFDDSKVTFAVNGTGGTYHIYMKDHLLTMIGSEPAGLFNFKSDRLLEQNIINQENEIRSQLLEKLLAFIQTYNRRLVDNDMVVRSLE